MPAAAEITPRVEFPALRDARHPVHRIADALEPYLRAIVKTAHPEKIILFGSQACGEPDEHSDVDLLVIRRGIASEKASTLEIMRAFRGVEAPNLSFTILSKTPERIADRLAVRSPFYEDIVGQGVVLYAC